MSQFSKILRRASIYVPTVIGEEYGGGYFAGYMRADGQRYALVISRKADGGNAGSMVLSSNTGFPLGLSDWDGRYNTERLYNIAPTFNGAAQFCYNLTAGGYNDWAVPARYQSDILFRSFKALASNNVTAIGANPYSDPVSGNYTAVDPALTAIAEFRSVGGAEAIEISKPNWTTSNVSATNNFVYLQDFTNGSLTLLAAQASGNYFRAVRMVKIPG